MEERGAKLIEQLSRTEDWMSAAELADRLGVSTRSVRSWVTALKAAAGPHELISSSPAGYRLNRQALAAFRASGDDARGADAVPSGPRERVASITTRLVQAERPLDVHELAASLFVSDSTVEADLARVRVDARDAGAELVRSGSTIRLVGPEESLRRLISRAFRDETARGPFELARVQEAFGIGDLSGFKTEVIELLQRSGFAVNEFGLDGVLVHAAIAVQRSGAGHIRDDAVAEETDGLVAALAPLVEQHLGAALPRTELVSLAAQLTSRVGTPLVGAAVTGTASTPGLPPPDELELVRELLARAQREYLVDLDDETFLLRLTLHLHGLVQRARAGAPTSNPLAKQLKASYPLTYELAVFLASEVQREFGISVGDDEIGFIALHVGAHLERHAERDDRVTCTLVCPGYHDLADLLRARLVEALGTDLVIERVVTHLAPSPAELTGDLVITVLPSVTRAEHAVLVQPFPTETDFEAVRGAIARIRRHRRRARIKDDLLRYFDERLFLRDVTVPDEESMIRVLGERMRAIGVVDDGWVAGAVERERLSSTAFTEHLAVPHSMSMGASSTAIAVAVLEQPMRWGDDRVNVVALIAFSAEGRAAFQTVFEQFVDVFADRADVQRLLRASDDFRGFIDELVRIIDE